MWNLYTVAKETASRPSDLFGIPQWTIELYGMPDTWLCLQFDRAVVYLGRWVQNKLDDLDDKGKPKHKLDDLLAENSFDNVFMRLVAAAKQRGEYIEVKKQG